MTTDEVARIFHNLTRKNGQLNSVPQVTNNQMKKNKTT